MSRLDRTETTPKCGETLEKGAALGGAGCPDAGCSGTGTLGTGSLDTGPQNQPVVNPDRPFSLSVVVPVYNEAASLAALHRRLVLVLEQLPLTAAEIILVDDGSRDASYAEMSWLCQQDDRVKAIRLARNFGKEAAMAAGLRSASGQAVVLMDSDLQHPPEVILDFVAQWQAGAQMVTGLRDSRATDSLPRRMISEAFYQVFHQVCDVDIPKGAGDFRLFDRVVVDAINALPERSRFMKGMASWVGFRQKCVFFTVADRQDGRSAWGVWRLFKYAFDGITSFSTLPLRVWSVIGLFLALLSVFYGGWIVLKTLIYGRDVPGYASLMVATLFLSGIQLISLGVMGEYLGRVFAEVKGRPLYLVAEKIGFSPQKSKGSSTSEG